jgi:signal transduction histidine kinase
LFGNDGDVTRVDLPALRSELDRLGLNWLDDNPSRDFLEARASAKNAPSAPALARATASRAAFGLFQPAKLAWLVSAGLVVTIGIGLYILRYQRRLFGGYLETEELAARREAELRETQAALLLSEKMKALGTMAAGVAHDFNNLLSVVRLSSELIEEQTQPDGMTRENFEAIQKAVQRGKGVVNSMLGYARDDGQVRAFAAGEMISEAVALLSQPFLSGLVLQIEADAATPRLTGRKGRLEQMLLNLIINAAEAMNGRGTLMLSARPVVSAGQCLLPPREAPAYVELFVKDSGPGIPPDVLPRIFEPFFTTKNKGAQHGTGLGLSMLYNMAKEDGIGVAVETGLGSGTAFRLLLPLEADRSHSVTTSADGRDSPIVGSLEIPDREP